MAKNYNSIRTMKGLAVGTILPWSGPISGVNGIPRGWIPCVGGRNYKISDYPDLYEIIGTRYGGSVADGYFTLPSITGKSLGDYHPSHATDLGYTGNFSTYLANNDDVANQNIVTQSSNIDLFVTLNAVNTLKATMTGQNITSSTYSDTFGYVERRLGDLHWGSHSHEGSFPSIRVTNQRIEDCQKNFYSNGASGCGSFEGCVDDCDNIEYHPCGNSSNATDHFAVPKYDGGEHLGRGRSPYGTDGYKMARTDDPKNFISESDDAFLYNQTSSSGGSVGNDGAWQGIYGTTLNTNVVNFQNSELSGHIHQDTSYSITTGNIASKQVININTASTGNITPVNLDNTEVMTIDVNVATPSIQMMYIIKAF